MTRYQRMIQLLEKEFQPSYYELENESHNHAGPEGRETHFRLVLVSERFKQKSRLDRNRWVHDLFKEELAQGLHALTQRLFTPEEWAAQAESFEMKSPDCLGKKS